MMTAKTPTLYSKICKRLDALGATYDPQHVANFAAIMSARPDFSVNELANAILNDQENKRAAAQR